MLCYEKIKDEIHIKIGGDHGGGSFKMSHQIANVKNPNSKSNTTVFSLFEAKDRRCNLKVGVTRFTQQVDTLQTMKWELVSFTFLCLDMHKFPGFAN